MATVAEILNGAKHYGEFTGKIVKVGNPRQVTAKGVPQTIVDLDLNDGTGTITWSCWSPTTQFMVGQMVTLSRCYVKDYNGKKSLALTKDGKYTSGGQVPAPIVTNAPASTSGLYDAPAPTEPPQESTFEIDDGLMDEEDIQTLIMETQEGMTIEVLDMLVKKNSANGLLDRRESLIIVAKQMNLDIAKPVYNPLDDLPTKPYVEMTQEELKDVWSKEPNPAARGLIEKVMMHQEYIEVHRKANELKKLELKLIAEVNRINKEYEEQRQKMLKDTAPKKKTKAKKKTTKAKDTDPTE